MSPLEAATKAIDSEIWGYDTPDGGYVQGAVNFRDDEIEDAPRIARAGAEALLDVEVMAAVIPAPRVIDRVEEWPEDEIDLYRNGFEDGRWNDFTSRGEALDALRRVKIARAIREALLA